MAADVVFLWGRRGNIWSDARGSFTPITSGLLDGLHHINKYIQVILVQQLLTHPGYYCITAKGESSVTDSDAENQDLVVTRMAPELAERQGAACRARDRAWQLTAGNIRPNRGINLLKELRKRWH